MLSYAIGSPSLYNISVYSIVLALGISLVDIVLALGISLVGIVLALRYNRYCIR